MAEGSYTELTHEDLSGVYSAVVNIITHLSSLPADNSSNRQEKQRVVINLLVWVSYHYSIYM